MNCLEQSVLDENIVARTAVQDVSAGTAEENVVGSATQECVVGCAAEKHVVAVAAVEGESHRSVAYGRSIDDVVTRQTVNDQLVGGLGRGDTDLRRQTVNTKRIACAAYSDDVVAGGGVDDDRIYGAVTRTAAGGFARSIATPVTPVRSSR